MPAVRVKFVMGYGFSSRLIAWRGGRFSHMAGILDDGRLLDSRSDNITKDGITYPRGVQIRPDNEEPWKETLVIEIPCSEEQKKRTYNAALSQVGKPYDVKAIFDFGLGQSTKRNWRDVSAWFCDELWLWALEQGRLLHQLTIPWNRIDPGGASLICSTLRSSQIARALAN